MSRHVSQEKRSLKSDVAVHLHNLTVTLGDTVRAVTRARRVMTDLHVVGTIVAGVLAQRAVVVSVGRERTDAAGFQFGGRGR